VAPPESGYGAVEVFVERPALDVGPLRAYPMTQLDQLVRLDGRELPPDITDDDDLDAIDPYQMTVVGPLCDFVASEVARA
jgi:hypothetical protein